MMYYCYYCYFCTIYFTNAFVSCCNNSFVGLNFFNSLIVTHCMALVSSSACAVQDFRSQWYINLARFVVPLNDILISLAMSLLFFTLIPTSSVISLARFFSNPWSHIFGSNFPQGIDRSPGLVLSVSDLWWRRYLFHFFIHALMVTRNKSIFSMIQKL